MSSSEISAAPLPRDESIVSRQVGKSASRRLAKPADGQSTCADSSQATSDASQMSPPWPREPRPSNMHLTFNIPSHVRTMETQ